MILVDLTFYSRFKGYRMFIVNTAYGNTLEGISQRSQGLYLHSSEPLSHQWTHFLGTGTCFPPPEVSITLVRSVRALKFYSKPLKFLRKKGRIQLSCLTSYEMTSPPRSLAAASLLEQKDWETCYSLIENEYAGEYQHPMGTRWSGLTFYIQPTIIIAFAEQRKLWWFPGCADV